MTSFVIPIVEGDSETKGMERLLQRVWGEILISSRRLQVLEVFRGKRDQLVKDDGVILRETIEKAFIKLHGRLKRDAAANGLILVLLDAEKSLPCELAPQLIGRFPEYGDTTRAAVSCVLANRMFENWIVAGAGGLAGLQLSEKCALPTTVQPPPDPEAVGGKHWIRQLLLDEAKHHYSETGDSVELVRAMNLVAARACSPSFDKLCRELEKLTPSPPRAEEQTPTTE